jgi:hypothetical protein
MYDETLESDIIEHLSKTFEGLSTERKDYILNTARSLLEIQDDGVRPILTKKRHGKGMEGNGKDSPNWN